MRSSPDDTLTIASQLHLRLGLYRKQYGRDPSRIEVHPLAFEALLADGGKALAGNAADGFTFDGVPIRSGDTRGGLFFFPD